MKANVRDVRPRSRILLIMAVCLLDAAIAGAALLLVRGDLRLPALAVLVVVCFEVQLILWRRLRRPPDIALSAGRRDRVASLVSRPVGSHRETIRDRTTGLYNRWYIESRIDQEAERCSRYKHSMAVLILKVDDARLSDMYADGWQEESAAAARTCLQVVRTVDLSAAVGPLEFAICLVHCDREGAEHARDRLVSQLAGHTCDAGIAVYPDDGCEPRALIELARVRCRGAAPSARLKTSA